MSREGDYQNVLRKMLVPTFSSNPTRHISVHLQMVTRGPASLVILFDRIHFEIKHLNVMGGFIQRVDDHPLQFKREIHNKAASHLDQSLTSPNLNHLRIR